jgi:hypothetical protein
MKLIHKITSSVQTCFPMQGHPTFTYTFHSGKYGSPKTQINKQDIKESLKEVKN